MAVVTSATTNTISGIKFVDFNDIPNLQIWLDSSDASTFTPSTLFQGQAWIHNKASYVATTTNSSLAFGTGDFTIEFWMYTFDATTTTQRGMFQSSDAVGGLKTSYTSGVVIHQGAGGVTGTIGVNIAGTSFNTSPSTVSTRFWHHIALVRRTGNATLYIDGVSVATASAPGNCTGTYAALGGYYNASYLFDGYLSNLRIVSGKAIYTSNFTVPTIPLPAISEAGVTTPVLTLQDSTLANNGNVAGINLSTSSGSLSSVVPSNFTRLPYYASTHSAWLYPSIGIDYDQWLYSVASGTLVTNSTLEFWFYPTNTVTSDTRILYGGDPTNTGYFTFLLWQQADFKLRLYVWVGSASYATSTNSMTLSSWNHVAFVTYNNNGTRTAKMFLNGVGVNISVPTQTPIALVREPRGFISPLRTIKNVALYNADFTPVTQTFPFSTVSLLSAEIPNDPVYITRWRDKSPNAITAFQRDNTRQPTHVSTTYTLLCSLNFNGTRQYLSLSTPVNVQNNYTTFFVYVRPTSSTYSISLANSYSSDTSPYLHWNSNWSYTGDRAYGSYTGTGLLIASLRKNDKLFINLADRGAPVAGWGGTKHSTVDSVGLYYPLSYFHNGLFCEYLQTTLMLPDHEIDMVTKALSAKWVRDIYFNNVTLSLNASTISQATLYGNTTTNSLVTHYNSQSITFDGNGDYLSVNRNVFPHTNPNWTFEMWVYFTDFAAVRGVASASDLMMWEIINNTQTRFTWRTPATWTSYVFDHTAFAINQWYHLAFSLSNFNLKFFINGTERGSSVTLTAGEPYSQATSELYIGASDSYPFYGTMDTFHKGYMEDVRITSGVARYVNNFTPPQMRI